MKNAIQTGQECERKFLISSHVVVVILTFSVLLSNCSQRSLKTYTTGKGVSESFKHFEGGTLFSDVELGLDILWKTSIRKNGPYKENLAFFVEEGLLIVPNKHNTYETAVLGALPLEVIEDELFVVYRERKLKVLGIIHTHPYGSPEPAPRRDFQYSYLGIHNFVMSRFDLYDGYKTKTGREISYRLGSRTSYKNLPLPIQWRVASKE